MESMESEEGSNKNPLFKQHQVKAMVPRNVLYWLKLWAKVCGRRSNAFASQIIISRVNDNIPGIQSALEKWAAMDGIEVNDLIQSILLEENFPFINSPESEIVLEDSDEVE